MSSPNEQQQPNNQPTSSQPAPTQAPQAQTAESQAPTVPPTAPNANAVQTTVPAAAPAVPTVEVPAAAPEQNAVPVVPAQPPAAPALDIIQPTPAAPEQIAVPVVPAQPPTAPALDIIQPTPAAPAAPEPTAPTPTPAGGMKIYIKTLTGKTLTLEGIQNTADREVTVADIKEKIQEKEGILPQQITLIFGGKTLVNDNTLNSYGITNEKTLHMVLNLRGGAL